MRQQRSEFFNLVIYIIWWIYAIIIILIVIGFSNWKHPNNSIQTWWNVIPWTINSGTSIWNSSWDTINSNDDLSDILITNGCDTTWFSSIYIASDNNRFYTTEMANVPTKKIRTIWDVWHVFICIIPDISDKKESYNDYRKEYSYNAVTYIKIWNYEGFYDVWFSIPSNQFYDLDSSNSKKVTWDIHWKYWTHELPLSQIIDTSKNVTLADTDYWGTREINLSAEFKDGKTIDIWAYMTKLWNNDWRASSIKEFKILRDWNWTIEIL